MSKMMKVRFQWKIEKDGEHGLYRIGETAVSSVTDDIVEAINNAIEFAEHLPTIEIEGNGISLNDYMEGCKVCYKTHLTKVLRVVIINGK